MAKLIGDLQTLQQLSGVKRIPSEDDIANELVHTNEDDIKVGNNMAVFVACAIDTTKLDQIKDKSYIVGYCVYLQMYSILHGRQLYMTSLFIEEAYRCHGLGNLLMQFMRLHGQKLGNDRFDVPFMLKNKIGIKFYQKMGATLCSNEYNLVYIDHKSLKSLANGQ